MNPLAEGGARVNEPFRTGQRVEVKGLEPQDPPMRGTVDYCLAYADRTVNWSKPTVTYRVAVVVDKGDPLGRFHWSGPACDVSLLKVGEA